MDKFGELRQLVDTLKKNQEKVYPLENFFPPNLVNTATASKLFDWNNLPENLDISGYPLGTFLDEFGKESTDTLLEKLKEYREEISRADQKSGVSTHARVNSIPEWEREYGKKININENSVSVSPLLHGWGGKIGTYLSPNTRIFAHTHPCEQPLNRTDMRLLTKSITMDFACGEIGVFLGIATQQSPKTVEEYLNRESQLGEEDPVNFWEGIKRVYKLKQIKRFIGEDRLSPVGEDIDKFYRNRSVVPYGRFPLEYYPQLADINERGHDLFILHETIKALPVLKIPLYFLPIGGKQFNRIREIGDVYPILKQPLYGPRITPVI